jgi:hypothetical protein
VILASVYGSVLSRLMAALIVVLVVTPWTEPFASIHGAVGTVDVGGESKVKAAAQDVLVPVLVVVIVDDTRPAPVGVIASAAPLEFHRSQRAILRL